MAVRHLFVFSLVVAFLFISCTEQAPPDQSSEQYKQAVSSFYLALAAIQADQAVFAAEKMNEISETYPQEPAVWANLGVFSMRRGNFELAAEQLGKAADRAPKNYKIQFLLGILESRRGSIQASIEHLNNATELAPDNVQVLYSLISELERQDVHKNADRIKELLNRLRELQPNNLAVMLEMTRIAAKLEAPNMLEKSLGNLSEASNDWPQEIRTEFEELRKEILAQPIENLTFEIAYLRNNLNQLPQFENDFDRIELPPNQVGFLITEFLWLPEPSKQNEAPDLDIAFKQEPLKAEAGEWDMAFHLTLAEDSIPDMMRINNNRATFLDGPTFSLPTTSGDEISRTSLETFDYNYDFLNDLVFVDLTESKFLSRLRISSLPKLPRSWVFHRLL
ncbi:MAG: hypothetical protein U5K69_23860 [Balneolaceae bacterium]|nr:hypothetical protein [Balneolaceae bacterium]